MSFRAQPRRLFVYGTLCDPDLFEVVVGAPMKRFRPLRAHAMNVCAVICASEPMPLLNRGQGYTKGLLLGGLSTPMWHRIHFYEDDVYALAPIRLQLEIRRIAQCGRVLAAARHTHALDTLELQRVAARPKGRRPCRRSAIHGLFECAARN